MGKVSLFSGQKKAHQLVGLSGTGLQSGTKLGGFLDQGQNLIEFVE